MGKHTNDQDLVKRVQSGDKAAFDLLVRKYQHRVVKLVSRYVHDNHEALDVAQEAFIKAYRAMPSFRGDSAFYTWLYRISINTAKNHLVSQIRQPVNTETEMENAQGDGVALSSRLTDGDSPERIVISDEVRDTVLQSIERLPEDLRTAIILRELEGMTYEEIAEAMDCPVGTVRSRLFRARESIDNDLRALGGGDTAWR